MRLWSLHPEYLDTKGLVALWRESLLAQRVLAGKTVGYRHHPQLIRFQSAADPKGVIARYLEVVAQEADRRGYNFDKTKITGRISDEKLRVARGQIEYEVQHLLKKLSIRDPEKYVVLKSVLNVEVHPLFEVEEGGVESWEIV